MSTVENTQQSQSKPKPLHRATHITFTTIQNLRLSPDKDSLYWNHSDPIPESSTEAYKSLEHIPILRAKLLSVAAPVGRPPSPDDSADENEWASKRVVEQAIAKANEKELSEEEEPEESFSGNDEEY